MGVGHTLKAVGGTRPTPPTHTSPPQANTEFGYALCDIITEVARLVVGTELSPAVGAYLIDKLSTLEYRLSHGVSEKLQLGALVGAFVVARSMMT